ncbi:ANTAR domain-containing protein [Streptomyces sp. NPDC046759]|uniref:ANTAR domain-containing protein n=1 Tax=Streptomyces sp. NPDC046759 TaxID=3155019 RepID=UPI0033D69858
MARGILWAQLGCSMEESWEILVEVSQRSNIRVRAVVEVMLAAVMGKEPFPRDLRELLKAAVARRSVTAYGSELTGWARGRWPGKGCDLGRSKWSFPVLRGGRCSRAGRTMSQTAFRR